MRSRDKLDVRVEPMPEYKNKLWMKVRILWSKDHPREFVPSFEDWYRMIRGLSECEAAKYAHRPDPLAYPRRFFDRCFDLALEDDYESAWDRLRSEFGIPKRD